MLLTAARGNLGPLMVKIKSPLVRMGFEGFFGLTNFVGATPEL
jgi:hypothetical protein